MPLPILAVEDYDPNLTLYRLILEPEGFVLHAAGTLQVAREHLTCRRYGLVLLDLRLPDGNGLDLAKEMRAHQDRTPILCLTAEDKSDSELSYLQALCDMQVAVRPADFTTLKKTILTCLKSGMPG